LNLFWHELSFGLHDSKQLARVVIRLVDGRRVQYRISLRFFSEPNCHSCLLVLSYLSAKPLTLLYVANSQQWVNLHFRAPRRIGFGTGDGMLRVYRRKILAPRTWHTPAARCGADQVTRPELYFRAVFRVLQLLQTLTQEGEIMISLKCFPSVFNSAARASSSSTKAALRTRV